MVFQLDIGDMQRRQVELRLFVERERRRFMKANLLEEFEIIVTNVMQPIDQNTNPPRAIQIDSFNRQAATRLGDFLHQLVHMCLNLEQRKMLEEILRQSLHESRRRSVLSDPSEQFCYYCSGNIAPIATSGINGDGAAFGTANLMEMLKFGIENGLPTPPPSNGVPTPQPPAAPAATGEMDLSSHTPSGSPPPSQPVVVAPIAAPSTPPASDQTNASQASKRMRLEIVHESPNLSLENEDSLPGLFESTQAPINDASSSSLNIDSDEDEKKVPKKVELSSIQNIQAVVKLKEEPEQSGSLSNGNSQVLSNNNSNNNNPKTNTRRPSVIKRRPKRSQTFGPKSVSQQIPTTSSHISPSPSPSPIVRCRPKSSGKSSIQQIQQQQQQHNSQLW